MTVAWYGHLRFRGVALWKVILASWGIAFFRVLPPGTRQPVGLRRLHRFTSSSWIQEVITLLVFMGFSALWLGDAPLELPGGLRAGSWRRWASRSCPAREVSAVIRCATLGPFSKH